ncbi:Arc family DNA-binding protein [Streptomyces sp. NPDC101234]|uniref:Arc family DNA-binding protein n=1 Tax=Streptomyces sp. NPDC101234 TaxID=3366138 RepID=UPI003800F7DC
MIRFSLRIPADLHERVTAQATADRRSLNSEILHPRIPVTASDAPVLNGSAETDVRREA